MMFYLETLILQWLKRILIDKESVPLFGTLLRLIKCNLAQREVKAVEQIIILASHGKFASGILHSLELICGKNNQSLPLIVMFKKHSI